MRDKRILNTEAETRQLAQALAAALEPGDTLLLSGPVGAGKSTLARALIRAAQSAAGQVPEEVPSPSYTLVQEYNAGAARLVHADLYRLTDPDEVAELGLEDAFGHAIVLVEWPALLGDATPDRALHLTLEPLLDAEQARRLTLEFTGGGWTRARGAVAPA